jgi:hypothetical protein
MNDVGRKSGLACHVAARASRQWVAVSPTRRSSETRRRGDMRIHAAVLGTSPLDLAPNDLALHRLAGRRTVVAE